jgi:hypothetical protein
MNGFHASSTVLLPFSWMQLFGRTVVFLTHEKPPGYPVFLSTGNSFLIGRQVANYSCLSHFASCSELQVLVISSQVGIFQRVNDSPLSKAFTWQALLSHAKSTLTGKQCAFNSCWEPWHLLARDIVPVPFSGKGPLAQRWYCSHCQTLTDRQCSFCMLNHFKLQNKVLEHLFCNICGCPTDIQ